jgi:periodic tryptophan protein 1
MISSLCWVPKGAAKAVPQAAPISEEELASMRREAEEAAQDVLDDDASNSDRDSEWETEDSEDAEMDDAAAAVAKARAVAASMASTSGRERSTGQVGV